MKIHIILTILTLVMASACASYENRPVSESKNSTTSGQQYSFIDKTVGKEFSRQ